MFKIINLTMLFSLILFITSCGPSDKEITSNSEEIVDKFLIELELENLNKAYDLYNRFKLLNRYPRVESHEIIKSEYINKEKGEIRVIADIKLKYINYHKKVEFIVSYFNPEDLKSYYIISSKGMFWAQMLNELKEDNVYKFLTNCNAIKLENSDFLNASEYTAHEKEYFKLVSSLKSQFENNVVFEKNKSNLISNLWGAPLDGVITLRNNNKLTIPKYSYDFNLYLYSAGRRIYTHKFFNDRDVIGNGNTLSTRDYELVSLPKKFDTYSSSLVIIDDTFIKEYINNNANYYYSEMEKDRKEKLKALAEDIFG